MKYTEWSMRKEILRRVRQEDEVRHARLPHKPVPLTNTDIPRALVWRDVARFVFLRQLLP